MVRNTVRSLLGILLIALASWLASYLTDKLFGPQDVEST
jgi:hypothetical protein